MSLVCGEYSTEPAPDHVTPENEVILNLKKVCMCNLTDFNAF